MSCPTCSATMAVLGVIEGRRHLHCPRCGTHRIECGYDEDRELVTHDTVPLLVDRARRLQAIIHRESPVSPMARHLKDRSAELGIRDSINLPGARPS